MAIAAIEQSGGTQTGVQYGGVSPFGLGLDLGIQLACLVWPHHEPGAFGNWTCHLLFCQSALFHQRFVRAWCALLCVRRLFAWWRMRKTMVIATPEKNVDPELVREHESN